MWAAKRCLPVPQLSSVQSLSCPLLFATPWTAAHRASLSTPAPRVYSDSYPLSQWCHPAISSSAVPFSLLQSFPASGAFLVSQLFASGGQSRSFSFKISPSSEYSGLVSFRMDWLDLLAVQGTLRSLLHHHSSKVSILHSAFFTVQLSQPIHNYWKSHSFD